MPPIDSVIYDTALEYHMHFQDQVPSVHCPHCPAEASEWITRTRHHGCPSKSVIKQVVRYGCDFVGVAHTMSLNRSGTNEWRFSFSKAEFLSIQGWTSSQRKVYEALSIINKCVQQIAKQHCDPEIVLCTYY